MKKALSIIVSLLLPLFIVAFFSPVSAACIQNGQCKLTGQTCCSNNSISVNRNVCASTKQCAAASVTPTVEPVTANTCSLMDDTAKATCEKCMSDDKHVWTAIGCIEVTSTGLVTKLLPFGIGIAGGIAFLLILFGALQMMISAGNPEKLNAGRELVTAAITGLLLIIFSIFILRLIGVQILAIPGFK